MGPMLLASVLLHAGAWIVATRAHVAPSVESAPRALALRLTALGGPRDYGATRLPTVAGREDEVPRPAPPAEPVSPTSAAPAAQPSTLPESPPPESTPLEAVRVPTAPRPAVSRPAIPRPGPAVVPAPVARSRPEIPSTAGSGSSANRAASDVGAATEVAPSLSSPGADASVQAHAAAARGATAGQRAAAEASDYRLTLAAWLERHKLYPRSARRAGMEERFVVRVEIDRRGRLRAHSIDTGGRYRILADAVVDLLRRADPFPPPPSAMVDDVVAFTVPIEFRLDSAR
jgi:protein TonB